MEYDDRLDVIGAWRDTLKRNTGPRRDPDDIEYPDMSLDEAQEILDTILKEYSHDEITWDILSKNATFYMAKKLHRQLYGEGVPDNIEFGNTIYDNWL